MKPRHVAAPYSFAEAAHAQQREFLAIEEGHHRSGAPIPDCIEIDSEIAIPKPALAIRVIFAGAEVIPTLPNLGLAVTAAMRSGSVTDVFLIFDLEISMLVRSDGNL